MTKIHSVFFTVVTLVLIHNNNYSAAQAPHFPSSDTLYHKPGRTFTEIMNLVNAKVKPTDTGEGGAAAQVRKFEYFWSARGTGNDTTGPDLFSLFSRAMNEDVHARKISQCPPTGIYGGNWRCIGPDSSELQRLAYIHDIWADPTDTSYLLAATAGGLFRSTDSGLHWSCITDNAPISNGLINIKHIAVHPSNKQIIYLGTSSETIINLIEFSFGSNYGAGLIYSIDGGANWQQEIPWRNVTDAIDSAKLAQKVFFSPGGGRLYVLAQDSIYFRTYPTGTWQNITPPVTGTYYWNDLEFVPGDSSRFFVAGWGDSLSGGGKIYKMQYVSGNHSSTLISTGQINFGNPNAQDYPGNISSDSVSEIDISIPTSSTLYAIVRYVNDLAQKALLRYNINTQQWTQINDDLPTPFASWHPCGSCFSLVASSANPSILYFSDENAFISTDSGQTFTEQIGTYDGDPTHGDIRNTYAHTFSSQANGTGDRLYYATDGGVALKPSNVNPTTAHQYTLKNINGKGLAAGHFFSVASSELSGSLLAGSFHNGFHAYEPDKDPKWLGVSFSDAGGAIFNRLLPNDAYGDDGYFNEVALSDSGNGRRINGMLGGENFTEGHVGPLPMWNDQFGFIKVGQTHMWHFNDTSALNRISGPQVPTGNPDVQLPEVVDDSGNLMPIRCMAFSHYFDTLTGYVVYSTGEIFYKRQNGAFATTFSQLSSPPTKTAPEMPPTSITIDPRSPERVWLGLGSVNWHTTPRKRVMYSVDAGGHWFDISRGLPKRLPVTNVIYQEGSSFVYASTDVGIYRCDMSTFGYSNINDPNSAYDSVEWKCFNKGAISGQDFPNVPCTHLEINYCDGKLYASTYGRSIWSTDIQVDDPSYYNPTLGDRVPEQTEIITANNTFWSSSRIIHTGIRIMPGASLTIQNTGGNQTVIHMPKNGAIVVEPGGTLVVDGARITNDCGGFWKGILVEGDPGLPQIVASYQGAAIIKNGAIIEHARVGVANYGESVDPIPGGTSGGIIDAQNSTFRNNFRGIGFAPYQNLNPLNGRIYPNASIIKGNTFIVDSNYRGETMNYHFGSHIAMSNVDGVTIQGNDFKNTSNLPNTKYKGFGIRSWSSSMNVVPYCTSQFNCSPSLYLHNKFEGFNVAISTNNSALNPTEYCFVDYADFKNNGIGIYNRYNNQGYVYHSKFELDRTGAKYSESCNCTKGIYYLESPHFKVEADTFIGIQSISTNPPYLLEREGIMVEQSRRNANIIYRNSFELLEFGCTAKGINKADSPNNKTSIGLEFKCNSYKYFFDSTGIGIRLIKINNQSYGDGIRPYQGTTAFPADNTFAPAHDSANPTVNFNQFVNFTGSMGWINYYYYSSPTADRAIRHIAAFQQAHYLNPRPSGPVCPASTIVNPAGGNSYTKLEAIGAFASSKTDWQGALSGLHAKMDRGSTSQLLYDIDMSMDGYALGDTLLTIVPYLSDEVLRAAAANDRVPRVKMMEVLKACPEMISEPLLEYLGFLMPATYPAEYIDTLREHKVDVSIMSEDLADINDSYSNMVQAHGDIIRFLKSDTGGVSIDSLAFWYGELPILWPRYTTALMFLGQHAYDITDTVLAHIPLEFSLTDEDVAEYDTYKDVIALLKTTFQDSRTELQLDSAELVTIQGYADRDAGAASYLAKNIYEENVGILDIACDSTLQSSERRVYPGRGPTGSAIVMAEQAGFVNAYPNPARDRVSFKYSLPNTSGSLTLIISTIGGQIIYNTPLHSKAGSTEWDARAVAPGTYLYKVAEGQKTVRSGRLSILR